MKQSDLQFSDPRIEKIDFRICQEENFSDDLPISIEVETESNPYCKEAIVTLVLLVGEVNKDNNVTTPFYFNGTIIADFKWNNEIKDPDNMLKISGGTVLLSYIRPILANLTMQAGLKPLNLPFINFATMELE